MTMVQNRRNFLTTLSLAGAAGLAGLPRTAAAAEPPPETTTIRLPDSPITCAGPLYMAEELLHEEGFPEVGYVPATVMTADLLASGQIDFDLEDGFDYLPLMDAGSRRQYLPAPIWDASNCGATIASNASQSSGANWRDYDPEDTIRFFALMLHEAGVIISTPNKIIAAGTDWRLFNKHNGNEDAITPYSHRKRGDLPCRSPLTAATSSPACRRSLPVSTHDRARPNRRRK